MLASINPLGERARGNHWWITVSAYVAASVAAGAVGGALVGEAGSAIAVVARPAAAPEAMLVALGCVAAAVLETGALPVKVPSLRRQVNEDWLHRYRGWVYGVGFGFQLGLGVVTIVTTAAVYLTASLTLMAGMAAGHGATGSRPLAAALAGSAIGATFGLVRSLPILAGARTQSPARLRSVHRRLDAGARQARWATAVFLVAVAIVAAIFGARWG